MDLNARALAAFNQHAPVSDSIAHSKVAAEVHKLLVRKLGDLLESLAAFASRPAKVS